jgi:uncharacterized protein (UPF0335 family)
MADQLGGNAAAKLKSNIDRILSLGDQVAALQADTSEIYKTAKGDGFDTKAMRRLVKRLRTDENDRTESEALDDVYWHAYSSVPKANLPEQVPVPPKPKPIPPPPPIDPPPAEPPAPPIKHTNFGKPQPLPKPAPPAELEDELPPELGG